MLPYTNKFIQCEKFTGKRTTVCHQKRSKRTSLSGQTRKVVLVCRG